MVGLIDCTCCSFFPFLPFFSLFIAFHFHVFFFFHVMRSGCGFIPIYLRGLQRLDLSTYLPTRYIPPRIYTEKNRKEDIYS
ncbi:hypothetical protein BDW02DRAFT_46850 [Decorospora gaudefroyi]|uniref:Uncharacterized protein n=1 Tax=Decorospora gaudefroyi TaxID=184978 RepID=A0A6A5K423_9PLEO|nr:hypothetical protein BDW02DRAFT_46850 [Decorospora gaudefroyi]